MRRFKATIDLYVQLPVTEDEAEDYSGPTYALRDVEAALTDGIGDTLRSIVDESFIIDWAYTPKPGGGFHYAEPFHGETPEEEFQAATAHLRD